MIPEFNQSGVLPPFLPNVGPTQLGGMAPYQTNLIEVVIRFANTPERVDIIRGLLDYRKLLRDAGVTEGFQWIDGSYIENCEHYRSRPPNDIDIVTFAERPADCVNDIIWGTFVQNKVYLFDRDSIKKHYRCDAYYEDLGLPSRAIVPRVSYWFGLFSHQRITHLWKGLLAVPLQADDHAALALLNGGTNHAS